MKEMAKLFAKKKKEGSSLSDPEKNAKMSVLHDLRNQASQAMGDKMKTMKVKAATPAKHDFEGPGDHSPEHGSMAGESKAVGPGADHPGHGSMAGELGREVGDSHPHHGSVAGEDDGMGPGEESPEHGSVHGIGGDSAGPPGDSHPQHMGSEGPDYSNLSVHEIDKHLAKLVEHRKRLTGK